jgi:hypothetical protein
MSVCRKKGQLDVSGRKTTQLDVSGRKKEPLDVSGRKKGQQAVSGRKKGQLDVRRMSGLACSREISIRTAVHMKAEKERGFENCWRKWWKK